MNARKESRITVRFTAEMRRKLGRAAKRSGKRESDLVREAVERHLDLEQPQLTAYEAFKRAGLIGVIKNAPPDLSTNKRYFDGFGES